MIELFSKRETVGVFRGFQPQRGGLEFHADLTLPYQDRLHNIPMHGQFLLVQLEHQDEAVLGRITSLSADGRLASSVGENYSIRSMQENRPVPEDLRKDYLRYRVNVRILGIVRVEDDARITFAPSHRRLPHVGSPVAFVSDDVLQHLVGHHKKNGADIGFLALGEYLYSGDDPRIRPEPWVQIQPLCAKVRFPIEHLVARRTFVFARAGYGKSNLNKLLFSLLYAETPKVPKRRGDVPVGTVIFDPEGEYFWPDDKGNPGLCDVPALQDRLVVFTARKGPSPFYQSFVAGGVKLDIRRLSPSDIISIALPPEKQDQQNVRKLRGMNPGDWAKLVDLVDKDGNGADLDLVQEYLRLQSDQQAEALAARANMTSIVRMLHDKSSQLMDMLLKALSDGKLCIIDVSQLRGGPSLVLSGLILRRIFDHNQEEFTSAESRTIPTIAVVEEAQSVLNDKASASTPYIEWVKEGRKYDLGAMLITQQPGSISNDILSQGDNWFVFHLLSKGDLDKVHNANAHFSSDLLSSLLNEPIRGQGVFWSGVSEMPYPISFRALSFGDEYSRLDEHYDRPEIETYASKLQKDFGALVHSSKPASPDVSDNESNNLDVDSADKFDRGSGVDAFRTHQQNAIEALKSDDGFWTSLNHNGIPWGVVIGLLKDALPASMNDRNDVAYSLVPEAMNQLLGPKEQAWDTERRGAKNTLFIVKLSD